MVAVLLLSTALAFALAQAVTFSSMSPQEECADMARRLATMNGNRLAIRLRQLESRWRQSRVSDDQLEAQAMARYPCLRYTYDATQCPQLQTEIDSTVGATLGARLQVLFPDQTRGMRERFAEMFVRSFCPAVTGPPAAAAPTSAPIAVLVVTPPSVDGFVPPAQVGVAAIAKRVGADLAQPHRRAAALVTARNAEAADVVLTITSLEVSGARRVVRATATVHGAAFDLDGSADDDSDEAADALAAKVVDWITENRARILQGRPQR